MYRVGIVDEGIYEMSVLWMKGDMGWGIVNKLFLRINVTEKNFCHMGNRTNQ